MFIYLFFFYGAVSKLSSIEPKLEVYHQKPWFDMVAQCIHLSKYFRSIIWHLLTGYFHQQVPCICLVSLYICHFTKHRSHGNSLLKNDPFLLVISEYWHILSYHLLGVPHLFNLCVVTWTQNIGSALVYQTMALLLAR